MACQYLMKVLGFDGNYWCLIDSAGVCWGLVTCSYLMKNVGV